MNAAVPGRFDWISRSGKLVIAARAICAFAQGFLAVLLAIFIADKGLGLPELGLFLSAGVFGGAAYAVALNPLVALLGRRRTLLLLTLLTAGFSLALLLTDELAWLMLFSFLGCLVGVGGAGGSGPAQPLEHAILADASAEERRAGLFGLYRFVATMTTALGGLAAGLPSWLERWLGLDARSTQAAMIVGFSLCLLAAAGLYARLGADVEVEAQARSWANPLRTPSRRLILGLNALFSVDQLGSALTTATLMAYWFHTRFGFELDQLAALAFCAQLLSALSMWLSIQLARRIGYVRTMVFTHIPASLMLIGLALTASTPVAVALWLGRGLLSQMDIPARDALTMTVVQPSERVAMASLNLVARNSVGTIGPSLSTLLWSSASAAAPLLAGGLLKLGYDLSLYVLYRDVESRRRSEAGT